VAKAHGQDGSRGGHGETLGLLMIHCVSRGGRAMRCVVRVSSAWMGKGSSEVDTKTNYTIATSTCPIDCMVS
jgi:hypothetical protein